jgi:hypothetical protein
MNGQLQLRAPNRNFAPMKAYIAVTGMLFLLLTLAHVWRVIVERNLASDPFFLVVTIVSTGMAIWALLLLRRSATARA